MENSTVAGPVPSRSTDPPESLHPGSSPRGRQSPGLGSVGYVRMERLQSLRERRLPLDERLKLMEAWYVNAIDAVPSARPEMLS